MSTTKRKQQKGRPTKPDALRKQSTTFWMKREMLDRLDDMKERLGLSSRGDMIRMLIESHPDYVEAKS